MWLDPDAADLLDELADAEHDGLLVAAAEELLAEGLAAYAVRKRRRVTE
ncbi:MAG: hypothetical protein ACRD0K_14260 [Egibacteraceae bacterium]